MTTAEEYRQYAAECLDLAERATNPNDKARLVQMAQAFLELADRRDVLLRPTEVRNEARS